MLLLHKFIPFYIKYGKIVSRSNEIKDSGRKIMQIREISIKNFKSIRELKMMNIDKALIVVGKNSTGKTVILDAILAVTNKYEIKETDFYSKEGNIKIGMTLELTEEDLRLFHRRGIVSKYKRYETWMADFQKKLPSFQDGLLSFTFTANRNGGFRYSDDFSKNNQHIIKVLPKIHFIDHSRNIEEIQKDIFWSQGEEELAELRQDSCIFDPMKQCKNCFQCIGVINKKSPSELTIAETTKLLEHKLYHMNVDSFLEKLNIYFMQNSERAQSIRYEVKFDIDALFQMNTVVVNEERNMEGSLSMMSEGTKSIYILSLLEAYTSQETSIHSIIMIEDPEIYLHPQLVKTASEILYRLSKKNQVIFSTHSPNLLFNFNSKQIRQVVLDDNYDTTVKEHTDIDEILNDLGYTANDLMNVSFVFIVEGKQDASRLPLLLNHYYSEMYDENGELSRVAIITTNSCTNIKTYANLKYINKLYLKDNFLMIRDGDGKDAEELKRSLCHYYQSREKFDENNLPRVRECNVLILKYYSFENYFLEPKIMKQIGLLDYEDQFFDILYAKYKEYLYRLSSVKNMLDKTGIEINSKEDIKKHFELIKVYVRGHNLFDIFYGRYKGQKLNQLLKEYVTIAPRDTFKDILDAIDKFVYFESKKHESKEINEIGGIE